MAFGGHLGFGNLRLHSEWFSHTRKPLNRYILLLSMAHSELKKIKIASGGHFGYGYSRSSHYKNTFRLDSPYQKTSKMTYCATFSDNYLEKLGFPRWHMAAILDMVILGSQNAKLHAEMDSSHQKTSKRTCCSTFKKLAF